MATGARGRRRAGSGIREVIAAATRPQFGELGYRRASLRSIAVEAGVDPRLVLPEAWIAVLSRPRWLAVPRCGVGPRNRVWPVELSGDRLILSARPLLVAGTQQVPRLVWERVGPFPRVG